MAKPKRRRKWVVSDEAVGIRSGRKFLEVVSTEASIDGSFLYFPVATTSYTGRFRASQMRIAEQLAKALNAADRSWKKDSYSKSEE